MVPSLGAPAPTYSAGQRNAVCWALYVSHLFSHWGIRKWEFAVGLLFLDVWPTTLLPVAIQGVVECTVGVLFGPAIGRWVDSKPRLHVVKVSLVAMKAALFFCAVCLVALLNWPDNQAGNRIHAHTPTLGERNSSLYSPFPLPDRATLVPFSQKLEKYNNIFVPTPSALLSLKPWLESAIPQRAPLFFKLQQPVSASPPSGNHSSRVLSFFSRLFLFNQEENGELASTGHVPADAFQGPLLFASPLVEQEAGLRPSLELRDSRSGYLFYLVVLLLYSMCGVSTVASAALSIAVQRDWQVVAAQALGVQEERSDAREASQEVTRGTDAGFSSGSNGASGAPSSSSLPAPHPPTASSSSSLMAEMNSMMRRIDLACRLLAPMVGGFIMAAVPALLSILIIIGFNILTLPAEYFLLVWTYRAVPALASKDTGNSLEPSQNGQASQNVGSSSTATVVRESSLDGPPIVDVPQGDDLTSSIPPSDYLPSAQHHPSPLVSSLASPLSQPLLSRPVIDYTQHTQGTTSSGVSQAPPHSTHQANGLPSSVTPGTGQGANVSAFQPLLASFHSATASWRVYARQRYFFVSLSLAVLFLTVLNFGSLLTGYLRWRGVSVAILGAGKGLSAVTGLLGTYIFPVVRSYTGTATAGCLGIWLDWLCILTCVLSMGIIPGDWLIYGVILSRLGLWMYDLAALQLIQETVPETERGVVGGVQKAAEEFFRLLGFTMGIVVSDPKQFGVLIIASFVTVTVAAFMYTLDIFRELTGSRRERQV